MEPKKPIASPIPLAQALGEPAGKILTACILTAKGDCLVAVDGGGIGSPSSGPGTTALSTDSTSPDASEVFTVTIRGDKHFTLQTANGDYVTAVEGGGLGQPPSVALPLPIITNGKLLQAGTVFHVILLGDVKKRDGSNDLVREVRLATPDLKHYVSAVNGGGVHSVDDPIRTDAAIPDKNEMFELICFDFQSQTVHGPQRP